MFHPTQADQAAVAVVTTQLQLALVQLVQQIKVLPVVMVAKPQAWHTQVAAAAVLAPLELMPLEM
jgi:hypothetical protein